MAVGPGPLLIIALSFELAACVGRGPDRSAFESKTARVDALFAEWNKPSSPGCSIGASLNGEPVLERGYGMANLELGIPITPASVFHVASISKPFTAMSVLLLAQRGQLSLDDPVWKYVPEWADREHRVTIRQLLAHTSGVRDGFLLLGMAPPREDGTSQNDEMLRVLARTRDVNFTPGTEFQYNNGTYRLLASIVERVSGQRFSAFADANIFQPLGMTSTHAHQDATALVPNRASGYHRTGETIGIALRADPGGGVGNAGLFTSARDLLRWQQNFSNARVGEKALLDTMQAPGPPTGWSVHSKYGLGLEISEYRGARTVSHGGGDPGYSAYMVRYPAQGLALALLCNVDGIGNIVTLTTDVANIYVGDVLPAAPVGAVTPMPTAVALPATELESKVGLYRDRAGESVARIFLHEGKLRASEGAGDSVENSAELTPVSGNRFVVLGTSIVAEFVPASSGRPQEVHVSGVGPTPQVSIQVTPFTPSRAELPAFAGQYTSREVEGVYSVAVRDSRIVIETPGRSDITFEPVYRDAFAGAVFGIVKFARDARGRVTGFSAHSSGARNLRFERQKE